MEGSTAEENRSSLFVDVPITRIEQDKLGRAEYAEHLAKIIQNHSFTESAVIGICGEWGTGKTSLMNLVELHLREKSDSNLHIVHFKPWRWSDERWLNTRFFDAIVKQAGIKDKDVRKLITTFVEMLCEFDKRLLIVKFLLMLVPGFRRSSGDSIEQVKEQLGLKLLALKKKIVVVLDDIDRLTPQEALEVMKLVKCNADFPNILYVMLYQRDILTKYLEEAGFREQAEFYLNKIEQVHFSVPQAGRQQVETILNEKLNDIINSNTQLSEALTKNSWSELQFLHGFYEYFKTIRDVNRYASSLSFQTNLFLGMKEFEVNLVDLMALELFRVFKPSIYRMIHVNRDILTGTWSRGYINEEQKTEIEKRLSSFQDENEKKDSEAKNDKNLAVVPLLDSRDRSIVRFLFPDLVFREIRKQLNAGTNRLTSEPRDEWYREKRLCHPDMFNRYFRMAIQDDDISHSDMARFQQALFHEQNFDVLKKEFEQSGKLEMAMTRIRYYLDSQKSSASQIGLFNLCSLADQMPIESRSILSLSLFHRATAYMIWILKELYPEIKSREGYLLAAMQNKKSLAAVARILLNERGKREKPGEFKEEQLLDDNGYEKLKKAWIELVSDTSIEEPNKLLSIPALSTILWTWYLHADIEGIWKWNSKLKYDAASRKYVLKAFRIDASEGERIRTKTIDRFFGPGFRDNVIHGLRDEMDSENRDLHELFIESHRYDQNHPDPDDLPASSWRSSTEYDG